MIDQEGNFDNDDDDHHPDDLEGGSRLWDDLVGGFQLVAKLDYHCNAIQISVMINGH